MLELKDYNKEDLKTIFGKNKNEIYFFDTWVEKYPILTNNDVFKWIISKIRKFAQDGKKPEKFQITSYIRPLQEYCNHNEVNNPSDLLKENLDNRNIRLVNYLTNLLNKGLNETSIKNAYQSRIKSFYSARGFPTTEGFKTKKAGKNLNEMNLTKEKIQKILNVINNSNYKLACKLQIHLGLRIGDILNQLPKCKILKHEKHYYIKDFKTEKEQVEIKYLFFPIELTKLLQTIYNIKDLTELDLSDNFLKTRISKEGKGNNMILANEYRKKLKNVASKLYPNENMKTHSFRKYFSTKITKVDLTIIRNDIGVHVEKLFKEHLLGHEVNYSESTYIQILNDINQFYDLWKPLENALCIDLEIVNRENEDILDLREQIVKLEKENLAIHKERTEFKQQIKNLEELTSKIPNLLEAYESVKKLLSENLKYISDKKIIETLGLKETPNEPVKKLIINKTPKKLNTK